LVVGTTGRGKSIMATGLAVDAAVQGFPTAMFSTEMLSPQVATRADSRLTGFEYNQFKRFKFSRADEDRLKRIIARRKKQLEGRLHIFDAPIGRCTINFVEEKLLDLEAEGIDISCVVVDSPDHFQSTRSYDAKRHEIASVFWDLKGLARGEFALDRKVAVWATSQAPQDFEHRIAGTRASSESYDKARISDIFLTLNQTAEQEIIGEMILNLAKYRDGESRKQIQLLTRFAVMRFIELGEVVPDKSELVKDLD